MNLQAFRRLAPHVARTRTPVTCRTARRGSATVARDAAFAQAAQGFSQFFRPRLALTYLHPVGEVGTRRQNRAWPLFYALFRALEQFIYEGFRKCLARCEIPLRTSRSLLSSRCRSGTGSPLRSPSSRRQTRTASVPANPHRAPNRPPASAKPSRLRPDRAILR